jgi:two-component system, LuxR family, response regulator FixJ
MSENSLPNESNETTVFIIDDDSSVRTSLSRLLTAMGFRTEAFGSAEEFLARERHKGVGCLVLDVRMPGLTGMDLQDELAKTDYPIPIVFITGHGNISMGVGAIKKGAVDFLPKPFDDEQLLNAVKSAIEKHRQERKLQAERNDILRRVKLLSPREYEIFRSIITGKLNKQIGYSLNIAEKTVKVHRGRVMEKLEVNSVAELVHLAEKAGIKPSGRTASEQ